MRHHLSRAVAAAVLITQLSLPAAAVHAQSPDISDLQALKARIDADLDYLQSTEIFAEFEFRDIPFRMPKGLYQYANTWQDVFNAWRSSDGLPLREYSAGTSADVNYGEGVDNWVAACNRSVQLILGYQALASSYLLFAIDPNATPEIREKIKTNLTGLTRETEAIIADSINGANRHCMYAITDMHYAFMTPHGSVCLANRMSKPAEEPDNGTGTCTNTSQSQTITLFTLPDCVSSASVLCEATARVRNNGENVWRDYRDYQSSVVPALAKRQENLQLATAALSEISSAIGAEVEIKANNARAALEAARLGSVVGLPLPLGNLSIPVLIGRIVRQILSVVGAIALLMFIWGGFNWMIARGDAKKVQTAKDTLTWATLGLFAIFAAYGIVGYILEALMN